MAPTFEHVLATRGAGSYRQYRIPALAVSISGTVLAAYDGRPNLDDLPNPIDLLLRRSMDGGRSWAPQQVVRTGTGLEGFGDPSLLVDARVQGRGHPGLLRPRRQPRHPGRVRRRTLWDLR